MTDTMALRHLLSEEMNWTTEVFIIYKQGADTKSEVNISFRNRFPVLPASYETRTSHKVPRDWISSTSEWNIHKITRRY